MNEQTRRFYQAAFFPYIAHQYITLGGVGGVGSWLAVILAKMGFENVTLFDYDKVEEVNLGGQLFTINDAENNRSKNLAASYLANSFSKNAGNWITEQTFDKDSSVHPICIAAFDNMKTRKLMFDKWSKLDFGSIYDKVFIKIEDLLLKKNIGTISPYHKMMLERMNIEDDFDVKKIVKPLYVDVRMMAEAFQIIQITPDTIDQYEQYMFDDRDVPDQDCSYRATTYVGATSAGMIGGAIANHLSGLTGDTFSEFDFPILL